MKPIPAAGEVVMGSDRVPWVDLRTTDVKASLPEALARAGLQDFIDGKRGSSALRLIVLALPQPCDHLQLELARRGVHLLTAALDVPAVRLLDQLQRHVQRYRTSRGQYPLPAAREGPDHGRNEKSESERVFSERPPWFDEHAWALRLQELQTPWSEWDQSKWDY